MERAPSDIDHEIAVLEQRARNGRALAANAVFEARECEQRAKELRKQLVARKKVR